MPCNTIQRTPITFEKVVYKPGHAALLIEALESMGFEVQDAVLYKHGTRKVVDDNGLKIVPKGAIFSTRENTILYNSKGSFQVPNTMQDRFTLEKLQNAYGMAAARQTAKQNGWQFHQISETEAEFIRR
jgi:anthranilate/para-aminobenzoate synthase component II